MHHLQYLATRAASAEEAVVKVDTYLNAAMGDENVYSSWYDWYVVGGGRWSPLPDSYEGTAIGTVQIGTNEFEEYLQRAEGYRKAEYSDLVKFAKKEIPDLNELLDTIERENSGIAPDYGLGMQLYTLAALYKMLNGHWNYNSYYFDTINDTVNPESMRESFREGNTDWWLVPVDFHS